MNKLAAFFIIVALFGFTGAVGATVAMNNYCMQPPFSARSLQPNVMIVMDNSGSMHEKAEDDGISVWTPANTYYGYFDPTYWYTYANGRFAKHQVKAGNAKQTTDWDGNFLDWMTMRRMDVVRKVIVGGTVQSSSLPAGFTDRTGVGPYILIGENQGGNSSAHTITNAGDLIDQTQANASVSAGTMSAFHGTSKTNSFTCVNPYAGSATVANVSWTLVGAGLENAAAITACVKVEVLAPDSTSTIVKNFGTADPASASILGVYNTKGAGTWQIKVTETDGGACSSLATDTIAVTATNMSITAGNLPSSSTKVFQLMDGSGGNPQTGLSSTLQINGGGVCSNTSVNVKVETSVLPTGIYQATKDSVRYGLMFYNNGSSGNEQGGKLISPVTNTTPTITTAFINKVEQEHPNSYTPLAETIWTAIGYFAHDTSAINVSTGPRYYSYNAASANSSYPINCDTDPYNFASSGDPTKATCDGAAGNAPAAIMVPCAQSYVILVTDGDPTQDVGLPTSSPDIVGVNSTYAGTCGSDTLASSTACDSTGIPGFPPGTNPGGIQTSNCCLDNVAFYGRTNPAAVKKERDLRADLTGEQSVISYMVIASFGNPGGQVLSLAARNGGFTDQNGNGLPDLASEYDTDGDGVPDTFFNATNGQALQDDLTSALTAILKHAGSATANSLIGAGQGQGANLLQAFFYPRKTEGTDDLTWVGFLENLWFQVDPLLTFTYIREDTVHDSPDPILNTSNDKIATFLFDPNVGDTTIRRLNNDLTVFGADIAIDQLSPIWEAGCELFNKNMAAGDSNTTSGGRKIYSTINLTSLVDFDQAHASNFFSGVTINRLQAANATDANNIINYIRGVDISGSRTRTTTLASGCGTGAGTSRTATWKLGDIIDSTAQIQGAFALGDFDTRYGDQTYKTYIGLSTYGNHPFVYAGGNDGMFHAFFMGKLEGSFSGQTATQLARVTDPDSLGRGKEQWAFIPRSALPYLRYLMDTSYCHLYYVNNPPKVFDASIGDSSLTLGTYPDTAKTSSTWRTIVIGSMGLGGGCGCATSNCVQAATTLPANEGLSSYFAFDVTDPTNPVFLWEFTDSTLGFSTSQPAIVRINASGDTTGLSKNGHWYVVIGSGPTGDVDSVGHQFHGRSDQPLKYFILQLKDGSLVTTKTPSPALANSFSGNLSGVLDADRNYSDEGVYLGYVQKDTVAGTWTKGGVLRLVTNEAINPTTWNITPLIQNIGPVPTKLATLTAPSLANSTQKDLWVFFGTGRYYFKDSSGTIDDSDSQRVLYGLKDPCATNGKLVFSCVTTVPTSGAGSPLDATTNAQANTSTSSGWFINLEASSGSDKAERLITDPQVSTLGAVFFTSFKPSSDPCTFGGKTFVWALRYDTGGSGAGFLNGTALTQTSTGAIQQLPLSSSFGITGSSDPNQTDTAHEFAGDTSAGHTQEATGRRTQAFLGQPPRIGALVVLTPPNINRVLRIQEQ